MSPLSNRLLARAEEIRAEFIAGRFGRSKALSRETARAAEELSRRIVDRLLAEPTAQIDRAEREGAREDVRLAARLFHLVPPQGGHSS